MLWTTECTWGRGLGTTFACQISTMFRSLRRPRCHPHAACRGGPPGGCGQWSQTATPPGSNSREEPAPLIIPKAPPSTKRGRGGAEGWSRMRHSDAKTDWEVPFTLAEVPWIPPVEPAGWLVHSDYLCNMFSFCWFFCWPCYFGRKTNHNRLKFYCNCGGLCAVLKAKTKQHSICDYTFSKIFAINEIHSSTLMQTSKLSSKHSNLLVTFNLCHVNLVSINMKNITGRD